MARGKTLEWILNGVRAEARISLNAAANIQARDTQILLIQREQERLWEDFHWPHLRIYPTIPLQAGQYRYSLPDNLTMDMVETVEVFDGGRWKPLRAEITDLDYETYETRLDQRSWPAEAWEANDQDEIVIWPIPEQNADPTTLEGTLRVTGIRSLKPLVEEGHRADLDGQLLVLYVAAGILAGSSADDAKLKMEAANKLYTKLKGKQTKTSSFNLFGTTRKRVSRLGRGPRNYMTS